MKINYLHTMQRYGFNEFDNGSNQFAGFDGFSFPTGSTQQSSGGVLDFGAVAATAANVALPGSGAIVGFLTGLFGNKPNPNDWQGWDAQDSQNNKPPGTSVAWWIITDGDSVQNEALNAISYMRTKTNGVQKVYDAAKEVYGLSAQQFTAKIVDKFKRAGYTNEANQFAGQVNSLSSVTPRNQPSLAVVNNPLQTGIVAPDTTAAAQKAAADAKAKEKKIYLIAGIVAAIVVVGLTIFFIVKSKK